MAQSLSRRLRQTRLAGLRRRALDAYRRRGEPRLSVVVPFYDSRLQLAATLESLLHQEPSQAIEIVLVDDGSTDGSRAIADAYADRHRSVRVVTQPHRGVGAARSLGVREARGDYLAFCDSDDLVPARGYARLVEALASSGADLAVGSVAVQVKGRYVPPDWARRSNPQRRTGVRLEEVPELLANTVLGARVFRRSFWQRAGLGFNADDERSDPSLVVSSLLAARTVDVIPAIVYRWSSRPDNRSLLQQDLQDKDRVAFRVRSVLAAGELVVAHGGEQLAKVYFAGLLHSVVPDLVRAAVCRDDGYWEALSAELAGVFDTMSRETVQHVPVEDRIVAWLCAQDQRAATEEFLEYAFDNQTGFPFRIIDGYPHIALPVIDALDDDTADLSRVAASDLRLRTRLLRSGWTEGGAWRVEGAAFVEYLDDSVGTTTVTLVLTERSTGKELRVPCSPAPWVEVNLWATRASEDHTGAGFVAEVDLARLRRGPDGAKGFAANDVHLELSLGGFRFAGPFRSRNVRGSAGLLESRVDEGWEFAPIWREYRGLTLAVRAPEVKPVPASLCLVDAFSAVGSDIVLEGSSPTAVDLRLVGPRGWLPWVAATMTDGRFRVALPAVADEWGQGATSVPADTYDVEVRSTGQELDGTPATAATALRRELPFAVDSAAWTFHPQSSLSGGLSVRVVPVEWRHSRPPLLRRRLRDEAYPEAKRQPLLDVVLFETFAGKSTGDNPGALCAEFHRRRGLGLELVYAVVDRSTVVPKGARGVVRWSEEWFTLLGRARYLVVNASLPYFFRKREGQLYFQTWHGSPLKRIAHDRPHLDFFNWHHRRQLLVAKDGWDVLLSQSAFCTSALSSAFRYTGPVLEAGYPRNDVLLSPRREQTRARVRAHLGIPDHVRAVLYAPTWRDSARVGRVFDKVLYLDPHEVVRAVEDSVVLIRGHYNSVGAAERHQSDGRVKDVTRYPDIAELYLAADVLVTDYSSVFFDFVLTDKPMIFLAPDLAEYRDDNRGFYLDYHETVPGPVCDSTDDVVAELAAPDRYAQRRAAFRDRFTSLDDGQASARVVDWILAAFPPGG